MPYLGSGTFADILDELRQQPTLPDSGAGLLSTRHRKSSTRAMRPGSSAPRERCASGSEVAASGRGTVRDRGPAHRPRSGRRAQLERIGGLGYVPAVLWLVARLADGLAHAHERGILHRDLKPANILLGDDGEPLLLDFNLAADTKLRSHASAALVGGTLPYMAPEHLEALKDGRRIPDARSDLYSLGVILFELLTGRHPFPIHTGPVREVLPRMIAERLDAAPGCGRGTPRSRPPSNRSSGTAWHPTRAPISVRPRAARGPPAAARRPPAEARTRALAARAAGQVGRGGTGD